MQTILDPGIPRWPDATWHESAALVTFEGHPDWVIPRGSSREADGYDEPQTAFLKSSIGDAFDNFRLLAQVAPVRRPTHLLNHVRTHGLTPLCRDHGLPVWHRMPARTSASRAGEGSSCPFGPGIDLERALAFARFFDSIGDVSFRIRRGKKLNVDLITDVLAETHRTELSSSFKSELQRDGALSTDRARQMVTLAVGEYLQNCGVELGLTWVKRHKPELSAAVRDSWGAYGLEMARRLSTDDERPDTYSCHICGIAVPLARRPREGDLVYCKTPTCQRERGRINKRRQRAGLTQRSDQ